MGGLNVKANEVIEDGEVHKLAEYVTFAIGEETYGVEVLKVQEIIGMTQITHVPNSMDFMKGVINLRGSVVPVVDMRIKFRMDEREYDAFTVILIVEVQERLIGLIVDSVSDVVGIPVESLQETPHFSANIETDYIKGIGNRDDQLIIILDVDLILSSEELERMERERVSS
jgi:purine-binding chemotaxis protein CheW